MAEQRHSTVNRDLVKTVSPPDVTRKTADFVLWESKHISTHDESVEFTGIPSIPYMQAFVELHAMTDDIFDDSHDPDDLEVTWGNAVQAGYLPSGYEWAEGWLWDPDTGWNVEQSNDSAVTIRKILGAGARDGGSTFAYADSGVIRIEFPFFADAGFKACRWHASTHVQKPGASDPTNPLQWTKTLNIGGGNCLYTTGLDSNRGGHPIDRIKLKPATYGFQGTGFAGLWLYKGGVP